MHPLDERSKAGAPNIRHASLRKLAKDGTAWTPTEALARDKALRQFCRTGRKGVEVSSGNTDAYRQNYDVIDWGSK